MKKIIITLICLLLLTGCDATYNIEIDNNNIKESTDVYFKQHDYNFEAKVLNSNVKCYSSVDLMIKDKMNNNYSAFDGELKDKFFYNKNILNNNIGKGININYVFNYDNYNNSSMLNRCSNNIDYINNKKFIGLSVELSDSCFIDDYGPYIDNLVINVKSDLNLAETNADEINNNNYRWYLKGTDRNKNIQIVMYKNIDNNIGSNVVIFLFGFIIFIGLFYVIFKSSNKKKK